VTRAAAATLAAVAALAAPVAAQGATRAGWDKHEQRQVVRAGILQPLPGKGFAGAQPLTPSQFQSALDALAGRSGEKPVAVSAGTITVAGFDRILVRQLGLADLAKSVRAEARRAGLRPPSRFGTEVVARQLGLRVNHPSQDDRLELYPSDPITRAEAAWSFARVLGFDSWEVGYARQVLDQFKLPAYTSRQKAALRLAVSKIGMPYVWGGESDTTSSIYGGQAHGGYDCSGFVWRVFKLSGNRAGERIGGRTAAQMAGEIPRSKRIGFAKIEPGDLLFFGSAGFRSRATESSITHVGIALSPQFMIHSSDQGVYVAPLFESWRQREFAWARRVL
jgi:cell wall-associated NlpC family hydrolase